MPNQVLYGFQSLENIFAQRVTEVDVRVVESAIAQTIEEHNRVMNSLMGLFVRQTTEFKIVYKTLGSARLQPADADTRAIPVRGAAQYSRSFPLKRGAHAWGASYEARLRMTVQDLNNELERALMADRNWMRDHLLAALFTNVNYTFTDEQHGALTIQPLANADTETYWTVGGAANPATAQHFLGQAAGIADASNPYPTIHSLLTSYQDNNGTVIALIPTNLRSDTENLATFHPAPDPRIRPGVATDVMVNPPGAVTPGTYIGYVEGVDVYEWKQLPDSRIVALTEGGEPPLAMREDDIAQLRGFQMVAEREDFPWYDRQFRRKVGFGTWNRTGAVVMEIGDASYDIPTNYDATTMA